MKLSGLKYLADENIHPGVVSWMLARGIDVATARQLNIAGLPDDTVLDTAASATRVLLTHDADFGRRAIAGPDHPPGVILMRPGHTSASHTTEALESLLSSDPDLTTPFLIVIARSAAAITIRIRSIQAPTTQQE